MGSNQAERMQKGLKAARNGGLNENAYEAKQKYKWRNNQYPACRKSLFEKLLQVFLTLKSSEKLMIENE